MSNPLNSILTDEEFNERVKEGKEFLMNWRRFKEEDADKIMMSAIELVKTSSKEEGENNV